MYKLYSKLGRSKKFIVNKFKTRDEAHKAIIRWGKSYGNCFILSENKIKIISNDEPVCTLSISK